MRRLLAWAFPAALVSSYLSSIIGSAAGGWSWWLLLHAAAAVTWGWSVHLNARSAYLRGKADCLIEGVFFIERRP
ncbi:hypothetical protein [Gryllotalpicola protaetiae]|uniref:Uncharacterized protein n=1 Tax=Gryllotalpicola protaetiae TaxID=2419771 RepID=A0A387BN27_9MICO|nr:hypothetical protein [Gryllotalpicola protaetiae]AYG02406.1 hypothetical protein D7I44_01875 [Gryllotalpicola protaetiae]